MKQEKSSSNKKRKNSDDRPTSDTIMNKKATFDNMFEEMDLANSQLISLARKVQLVDHDYFLENSEMFDEFIGNIHEFLRQVDNHRKRVTFCKFNSDILLCIFQFLDNGMLLNSCALVSKLWKQSFDRVEFKLNLGCENAIRFKYFLDDSPIIKQVTSLKLTNTYDITFELLWLSCDNLKNLKSLDLCGINMKADIVRHLKKCNLPNLTELNLEDAFKNFTEIEANELFNSTFMASVKKLDISYLKNPKPILGAFSNSKYSSQITHLKINSMIKSEDSGIDLVLKDKLNLEYLEMECYDLSLYPNLFTKSSLMNITYLLINECDIRNRDFANLIVSPNLPNLKTLQATSLNGALDWSFGEEEYDSSIATFPPKSQSSLTDLNILYTKLAPFPTLIEHCRTLKRLTFSAFNDDEPSNKVLTNILKSPNLSELEYLEFSGPDACLEIVFTNPCFSNLKVLKMENSDLSQFNLHARLIEKCTTLVNLTSLEGGEDYPFELTQKMVCAFKSNPTFSKLKKLARMENDKLVEEF